MLAVRLRFEFERDAFAFPNELVWEYHFDEATGATAARRRVPAPDYALRCFVLIRAARQFLYHARFDPATPPVPDDVCRRQIRAVLTRNPRRPSPAGERIVIPGYAGLREMSVARAPLLKRECGGAWRSYVLRSHWHIVVPVSRSHQDRTARELLESVRHDRAPIVHLLRFPSLTINHGMVVFDARSTVTGVVFSAYDPNEPARPAKTPGPPGRSGLDYRLFRGGHDRPRSIPVEEDEPTCPITSPPA